LSLPLVKPRGKEREKKRGQTQSLSLLMSVRLFKNWPVTLQQQQPRRSLPLPLSNVTTICGVCEMKKKERKKRKENFFISPKDLFLSFSFSFFHFFIFPFDFL